MKRNLLFHLVFVVIALFELHQSIYGVIGAVRGDGFETLIFRLSSLIFILWAYVTYVRRQFHLYLFALSAFCVVNIALTVITAIDYADKFPEGSFVRFHFIAKQIAKCQIGDFWGCGYLIVDAYALPVVLILLVVSWYGQSIRGRIDAVKNKQDTD